MRVIDFKDEGTITKRRLADLPGRVLEDSAERDFRTGDSLPISNGFRGLWEVLEKVTKHFLIWDYSAVYRQVSDASFPSSQGA